MTIYIKFEVKTIMFREEETGFTILNAKPIEYKGVARPTSETIIKGFFFNVMAGDEFTGEGDWIYDKRYGHQIDMNWSQLTLPRTQKAIMKFLQRFVQGCGKVSAKKLVDAYKLNTLEMCKTVGNITALDIRIKLAEKIQFAIKEHSQFEQVAIFLFENGMSYSNIIKIYEEFGSSSVRKIKDNPYVIINVDNIGFTAADKVANNLNWEYNNPVRLQAALLYFLEIESKDNGDLYTNKYKIYTRFNLFLEKSGNISGKVTKEEIDYTIQSLLLKKLKVEEDEYVYLIHYNWIENGIVTELETILAEVKTNTTLKSKIDNFIENAETDSFRFAVRQKEAIHMALNNNISILTGGPGTGKTQTINSIIKCIQSVKPTAQIELCAPTGKAAKRMTELTNMESKTIHRLIGLNMDGNAEEKEIEADYLIVDESSMIDAYVFLKLLKARQEGTKILLVGDAEQLPSVGPGLILRDLIKSDMLPVTTLNEIFRQAQDSQIVMNAHKIINGDKNLLLDNTKKDFYFVESKNIKDVQALIIDEVESFINQGYKLNDIQILSPMKKGDVGVDTLNLLIQQQFNPIKPKEDKNNKFRKNDKVIQTINNYDLDVFNGEVGIITKTDEEIVIVDYGNKDVEYQIEELDQLELAYAITIHKSQGSEFPIVIMPINDKHNILLNRNIIYTGITRAKEKAILIGCRKTFSETIDKTSNTNRNSRIVEKLK